MTATRNGILLVLLFLFSGGATQASGVPPWLPRYDLEIRLDPDHHTVLTRQQVTWTNHHQRSATELIFNAHAHYKVPDKEVGYFAKTLELLRMNPGEALDTIGEALQVDRVTLVTPPGVGAPAQAGRVELPFQYAGSTATDLVISLPHPVGPGETITVILEHTFHLPQRMGRWGQWQGVTTLSNWLPVLAVYDDEGWHPTPFIPWHQPFFNEAGVYNARVTLPHDQKVGCSGTITSERLVPGGQKEVSIVAEGVRDFALLCSARYEEFAGQVEGSAHQPPVRIHVMAFPEHEYYAREMVRVAAEAIAAYGRWFGLYPYPAVLMT